MEGCTPASSTVGARVAPRTRGAPLGPYPTRGPPPFLRALRQSPPPVRRGGPGCARLFPLGLYGRPGRRPPGCSRCRARSHPGSSPAQPRSAGRRSRPSAPPRAALRHQGRVGGALAPFPPVGAVGAGVGTQHRPHSLRPCGPALLAVGVAEGRPRGGGAFRNCEGRLRSGAPPLPTARSLGGLLWSATHVLWAQVCGCGGPALSPLLACPVGAACVGDGGGRLGSGAPSSLLPALWAGCRGPLAACCGRGCGCVRCVWCLCGACCGAWCRLSPVPLGLSSPVLRCGVVLAVCLPCPLPCACPLLRCWLPPVSFVASSLFTPSSAPRWLALLPGMHFFPASPLVCFSVFFLAGSSFSVIGPCETKE